MPRGNDAAAAREELEKSLGGVTLNAEAVILANRARWTPELRAANNKRENEAAKASLSPEAVQAVADNHDLGEVCDYTVRGSAVVVVFFGDEDGKRTEKDVIPLAEVRAEQRSGADEDGSASDDDSSAEREALAKEREALEADRQKVEEERERLAAEQAQVEADAKAAADQAAADADAAKAEEAKADEAEATKKKAKPKPAKS